jgi:tripartite motif-containing protein 71
LKAFFLEGILRKSFYLFGLVLFLLVLALFPTACTKTYLVSPLSVATPTNTNTPMVPTVAPTSTATMVCEPYVTQWGGVGSGAGQFYWPQGVAIDASGNVLVVDADDTRVEQFTTTGTYLSTIISGVSGPGIAVDSVGNIYVSNSSPVAAVKKYSSTGVYITQWGPSGAANGDFGNGGGGIAVDSNGNINVVDGGNSRVEQFSPTGTYILQWGSNGSGAGQFNQPEMIAADTTGNIYVADYMNSRIEKFNTAGVYLTQWPISGPWSVAVDPLGNVYVTTGGTTEKFTNAGTLLCSWSIPTFDYLEGMAIDHNGYIYLSSANDSLVLKYGT